MRTGSYSMQQGLTPEAASIVKQAVTLAKRRGHAQVTPLHVASTMLSITNGLLRNACLQSHSHPLQCKALELCFNVALNRLPASTSSPMLGSHHHHHSQCPQISNALVAAFKRAQAHQRRGSIENQQQPILAVKIELEQLVISILDDPSVSRVMKEAGFSSPQVKSNVEQAVSLEICSSHNNNTNSPSISGNNKPSKDNSHHHDQGSRENKKGGTVREASTWWNMVRADVRSRGLIPASTSPGGNNYDELPNKTIVLDPIIRDEDVSSVMEILVSQRRRSIVIVGECVATLEGVVRGVMGKVEKGGGGGGVGESSLRGVKFVPLSLSSFVHASRVEVEQKVEELRSLIARTTSSSSHHGKGGCVLYLGDLKWVFDYYHQGRACYYCPVDHMVMEIAKLVSGIGENNNNNNGIRFWVVGIATFKAYMGCKNGNPSLESLWGLHPITTPAGSLSLSLITSDSGLQNEPTNTKADDNRSSLQSSACNSDSSSSSLPAWLQQYKNENKGVTSNDQECVPLGELCKKWNSMCSSGVQKQPYPYEKTLTLSPSSSTSGFSYEHHQNPIMNKSHHEPTLQLYTPESKYKDTKNPFSSSNNPISSNPNSSSSSDVMEMEYINKFKDLNSENLKTLCNALEKKVPWQKDIIPEIVSTLLQCRSGKLKRKGKVRDSDDPKEETWLLFQGVDIKAKEKIARELARVVFGSHNNFISISMSNFASTRADSAEDCCKNKRSREEPSCSYIERFAEAVSCNPHRVFFVEDIEQADYCSQLGFKRAIENGRVEYSNGEEFGLCDAIIILSCESFSSRSRACSPLSKQKTCEGNYSREEKNGNDNKDDGGIGVFATLEETNISPCVSLDLDLNISIDDDEDRLVDEIGLLESVDRRVIFKIQEL